MRTALLAFVALGALAGCKKPCPMGGAPLNEVVAPFSRFNAYPPGMKACSPAGGLDTPTFFFDGADLTQHADTMNAFLASKGFVVQKSGPRGATKSDFEAALKGRGGGPGYDLVYKAASANTFVTAALFAKAEQKRTDVLLTVYDCSQKVVNGMMADLCRGASKP